MAAAHPCHQDAGVHKYPKSIWFDEIASSGRSQVDNSIAAPISGAPVWIETELSPGTTPGSGHLPDSYPDLQ